MAKPKFNAFEGPMGGEVVGFDPKAAFDDDTFAEIRRLLRERICVVVRDQQDMTPDELMAFTLRFGEIKPMHLAQYRLDGHPEIWVISNIVENGKPLGLKLAGTMWHTDEMYLETPVSYTFLLGKEVPPVGGDTLFANMYAAYDALPESTKAEIDGLTVVVSRFHAYQAYYPDREPMTDAEKAALPEVIQPLVRVHPETGLKALYCGGGEGRVEHSRLGAVERPGLAARVAATSRPCRASSTPTNGAPAIWSSGTTAAHCTRRRSSTPRNTAASPGAPRCRAKPRSR